jgi:hypothetical protein
MLLTAAHTLLSRFLLQILEHQETHQTEENEEPKEKHVNGAVLVVEGRGINFKESLQNQQNEGRERAQLSMRDGRENTARAHCSKSTR